MALFWKTETNVAQRYIVKKVKKYNTETGVFDVFSV